MYKAIKVASGGAAIRLGHLRKGRKPFLMIRATTRGIKPAAANTDQNAQITIAKPLTAAKRG